MRIGRPSFQSGVARLLDLFGQYDVYDDGLTPAQSDAIAIQSDWTAVERDMSDSSELIPEVRHTRQYP